VSVVCAAAEIPMTPPFSAQARSTSSGFMRFVSHSARAPACVTKTGRSLRSIVSSDVRSPACERSIASPSRFIRRTACRPNSVSPASCSSRSPEPSAFASL
jgi:hypothetical protein